MTRINRKASLTKLIPLEKISSARNENGLRFNVIIWQKLKLITAKRTKKVAALFSDKPIAVNARSKAWVYVRLLAGIEMDVCLL